MCCWLQIQEHRRGHQGIFHGQTELQTPAEESASIILNTRKVVYNEHFQHQGGQSHHMFQHRQLGLQRLQPTQDHRENAGVDVIKIFIIVI